LHASIAPNSQGPTDGRGPWSALRRSSMWCAHDHALSRSGAAIALGGAAPRLKLRESSTVHWQRRSWSRLKPRLTQPPARAATAGARWHRPRQPAQAAKRPPASAAARSSLSNSSSGSRLESIRSGGRVDLTAETQVISRVNKIRECQNLRRNRTQASGENPPPPVAMLPRRFSGLVRLEPAVPSPPTRAQRSLRRPRQA
jgi:hypothetical protein